MAMWRAEAIARLPEVREKIDAADSVMALWGDLWDVFQDAYRADPPNESLIARVYSYADWCLRAPRGRDAGHDPLSAVIVSFHEHIPAFRPARDDMPRWFTYEEVAQNREIFSYMIGEREYLELLRYMEKHKKRYRPRGQEVSR